MATVLVLLFLLLAAVLSGLAAFGIIPERFGWGGFCSFVIAVLIEHIGKA
jgi:hypothetical protein